MDRIAKLLGEFATKDAMQQHVFFNGHKKGVLVFNPELYDAVVVSDALKALKHFAGKEGSAEEILESLIFCAEVRIETEDAAAMQAMLCGECVLEIDGWHEFIVLNSRKYDKRSVAEPPSETVLRGPREGFIEDIKTNLALIRKRVKSPALAIERFKIGRVSSTDVALLYISTIAEPRLIKNIRKKLQKIDIDALLDSFSIQTFIEDHPYSLFKQAGSTEKPDIAAAKMLEGRVVIIADGSPVALTVPFIFLEEFQAGEDYYSRYNYATFLRYIRLLSAFLAILMPGLYVALQVFHHSVIPVKFLITLQNAIAGIPLSPMPEILFVTLLFEIIREAGLRMPRAVGMALSIVGALVLGETAVKAGLISSPAVMITALSSLALYTIPNEVDSISILRVLFTIVGGVFGLLGIVGGCFILIHYLASLDSFGTPYLAPLAPLIPDDLKDAFSKKPLFSMRKRPKSIPNINANRLAEEENSDKNKSKREDRESDEIRSGKSSHRTNGHENVSGKVSGKSSHRTNGHEDVSGKSSQRTGGHKKASGKNSHLKNGHKVMSGKRGYRNGNKPSQEFEGRLRGEFGLDFLNYNDSYSGEGDEDGQDN